MCHGDTFVRFFVPKGRRMHLRLLYTVRTKMSAFPRTASSQGRFPPKGEGGRRAAFRLRQKVRQQQEAMKHRFQKTAKRWLAMLLCVGMLCQPGLFSAFAQEGPASPAPSATPGEAPAAAPAAAAAPRAGTEYPLTNADFSLSGTLTIDGETPDENTVIQDGTNFNIRLDWKLPDGQAYTADDTFTIRCRMRSLRRTEAATS